MIHTLLLQGLSISVLSKCLSGNLTYFPLHITLGQEIMIWCILRACAGEALKRLNCVYFASKLREELSKLMFEILIHFCLGHDRVRLNHLLLSEILTFLQKEVFLMFHYLQLYPELHFWPQNQVITTIAVYPDLEMLTVKIEDNIKNVLSQSLYHWGFYVKTHL
jgi:hypothetical protein